MKPITCLIRLVQMYRIEAEQIKIRITSIFQRSILDLCSTSLHGARGVLQGLCFPKGFREHGPDRRQQEAQEHVHNVIVFTYSDTRPWASLGFQLFAVLSTLFVNCRGRDPGKGSSCVIIKPLNRWVWIRSMGAGACCSLAWMREKVRREYPFLSIVDRSDYISSYSVRADTSPVKTNF